MNYLAKSFLRPSKLDFNDPAPAHYHDLIDRLKQATTARRTVTFDPLTGKQDWYIDGKLVATKYVKSNINQGN
jgi:hypothetical protein